VQSPGNEDQDVLAAPDFNVRDYARNAVGSYRSEQKLDEFESAPLPQPVLRLLRYLASIERATMGHLRNVLVTATHKDARVTAFLGTWAFEKFWIADALENIVDAHGDAAPPVIDHRMSFIERLKDRFGPITRSITANKYGVDMVAVHMTMGTIDEWLMQAAYSRLAELEKHPELARTLAAIAPVKARQLEFFEAQSRDRLGASTRTQNVTRNQLRGTAWPIGAAAEPAKETAFFYSHLFGSPADAAALDTRIDSIPGLAGLGLVARAQGATA
jgi:hypothetical protein